MKKISSILMIAGLLSLCACIISSRVSTKVAQGVRLEDYKTYKLQAGQIYDSNSGKTGEKSGVGSDLEIDVREELEHRGLKHLDSKPDLTFRYVAGRRLRHTDNQMWSLDKESEHEWIYQEGAVSLIATDAAGRMVWSSHMQAVIDPSDKTHRQLKKALSRAFKNYPSVSKP